jgi:hypothetical protein
MGPPHGIATMLLETYTHSIAPNGREFSRPQRSAECMPKDGKNQ